MSRDTWVLLFGWLLLLGLVGATLVAIPWSSRVAHANPSQARPFNVYQSGSYCVYIASNQAGIAMQVVSNYGATCQ